MAGARYYREGFDGVREVCPLFLQAVDVYMLCLLVYAHTHTMHVRYLDVSPIVGQDTWRAWKKSRGTVATAYIYHTVYEVHMYTYMLGYR